MTTQSSSSQAVVKRCAALRMARPSTTHTQTKKEVVADPYGAWDAIQKQADRIEELEAKLAKLARAAKPFAAIKIKDGRSQPGEIGRTDVTNLRAALAELKGEDRG